MIRHYLRHIWRTVLPLLYGRTRFRLFLKSSFGDIDRRVQELAAKTDYFSTFVRPIPVRAPFGKSVLVVAPHQDDEAIGCGGALALQAGAGQRAFVVFLQDGADGHDEIGMTRDGLVSLRNEESRRAAAVLGLESPCFLGFADLGASIREAAGRLQRIIRERHVDAIFAPFIFDAHPDHRFANYALAEALEPISWPVRVFGYEVWGLVVPNVIVVIDDVIDKKMAMLACFEFANKAVDYVHSTQGLNMYRSRLLGSGLCRYAECFFETPREEYVDLVKQVRTGESAARIARIPADLNVSSDAAGRRDESPGRTPSW